MKKILILSFFVFSVLQYLPAQLKIVLEKDIPARSVKAPKNIQTRSHRAVQSADEEIQSQSSSNSDEQTAIQNSTDNQNASQVESQNQITTDKGAVKVEKQSAPTSRDEYVRRQRERKKAIEAQRRK